ncbi:MAG: flagellin [Roseinatronobacter sp.]
MSSILTNSSAMVALQTLRGINKNLSQTQSEISTGKSVANARDNAAVWSISKTMESDVQGFKSISDSLALGSSTVAVARTAAETVTKLLSQMKGLIVSAQEENVDKSKIQSDVDALREQVRSVVGAAQFNGLNLVNQTGSVNVLSSLDRSADGTVSASSISINRANLSSAAAAVIDSAFSGIGASGDGSRYAISLDSVGGDDAITIDSTNFSAGDRVIFNIGDRQASYTVSQADLDDQNDPDAVIAAGMRQAILNLGIADLQIDLNGAELTITNNTDADLAITARVAGAGDGTLAALNGIDVTTGATGALAEIDTMINVAIQAAANFGSAQKRIDTQAEFVKSLSDALTTGIGSLVDADMEATSARLQALQVQQQLATQSLSIANQQPQNILSLFR